MNAHQRRQLDWMQQCARLAASGAGHTPESRQHFQMQLVQRVRDDARVHQDLFDRIASDNRPY